jgi:hypothetical protein
MGTDQDLYRFTLGDIRWLAITNGPAFLEPLIQNLAHGAELLRATRNRRVMRVDGCPSVIVKHFLPGRTLGLLKSLIRGDPALREWNALRQAARHELPVPKAVAVGWRYRFARRESFLVTEALNDAVPLGQFLYGVRRAAVAPRRKAIEQAARVLRRAHDAGMFQRDLHLDNLMVRVQETGPQVFLIDLQRVDFRRPLRIKERLINLAELHGGCTAATHAERLRFLKTYLLELPGVGKDLRPLLLRLETMALKHRLGMWRSRQKRCLADNRDFVKLRVGRYIGCARRDWAEGAFLSVLSRPVELLSSCAVVKDSRTTTVGAGKVCERGIHVKRYNFQGLGYALKDLFRVSRAKRAWIASNSCVMRGLSVAEPVVYLERRRGRFLLESYLVSNTVEGQNLTEITAQRGRQFSEKRDWIDDLAQFLARMHGRQVANRDLKGANVVVSRTRSGRYDIFMVDFDGVEIGPVSWRVRVKNLTRLAREFRGSAAITRTDRLRFLRTYLGPRFADRWKRCWRGIARQADVD